MPRDASIAASSQGSRATQSAPYRRRSRSPSTADFATDNAPAVLQMRMAFLTYAQSGDLTSDDVADCLYGFDSTCRFVGGRERHQDGSPHIHVFVTFSRKMRTRNRRVFDIRGHHPNIVGFVHNPAKCWDYVTKGGDTFGDLVRPADKTEKSADNAAWAAAADAASRDEMLTIIKETDPRRCVRRSHPPSRTPHN